MNLHQLQASYYFDEDRVLLRTSFMNEDGGMQEIRAWLTRRMVKALWPGIITAMETQVSMDMPHAAHAKSEIVSMEHESSVDELRQRGDFDIPFEANAQFFPLGEEPVVVQATQIVLQADSMPRVSFTTQRGTYEVAFNPTMLHGFCTLLKEAVSHAEWDIELEFVGQQQPEWGQSRLLN